MTIRHNTARKLAKDLNPPAGSHLHKLATTGAIEGERPSPVSGPGWVHAPIIEEIAARKQEARTDAERETAEALLLYVARYAPREATR